MINYIKKIFKNRARPDDTVIKNFIDNQDKEEAYEKRTLGIKSIPLGKIVGSVGRYRDFNKEFRLKGNRPSARFENVTKALRNKIILPPIVLYQIKNEYYVLDGNHRVAAAKKLGYEFIDAQITEFLPSKKTLENIIYRERSQFIEHTQLPDMINLTEVGKYDDLAKQIDSHYQFLSETRGNEVLDYYTAAQDWYKSIYRPLVKIIENSRLACHFPTRTKSDFYAYVSKHQWERGKKRKYGIGIDRLIPKDMEEFRSKMEQFKEFELPDMKHWISAFILIEIKVGKENVVMKKLHQFEEIQEVHFVHGVYDLIAKINLKRHLLTSDAEIIGDFMHKKVRQLKDVRKTQTLIPVTSLEKNPLYH